MAKVLLVDTNFSSVPIYKELEKLGHEVHVVGGNPSDCLAKISKHYSQINYADTDLLNEFVYKEHFDFLVPGCTDRSYTSCAVVSNGKFPGIESKLVDETLNNKAKFRDFASKLGLPIPSKQYFDEKKLRYPLIVKPVDSFSGKGISVIDSPNQIKLKLAIDAAKEASSEKEYLIEDFVEGTLHSHSAFIYNGKVIMDFVVDEFCNVNPFVVDTSKVAQTVLPTVLADLRQCIELISHELQLQNGLIHTQFKLDGDQIWLIEITRRCPGDLYSQLIELATGESYVWAYVAPYLGQTFSKDSKVLPPRHIMRHTVTIDCEQTFGHLSFEQQVKIERWISLSLTGDCLKPSPMSRVGILFAEADSKDALDEIVEKTIRRNLYSLN